MGDLLVNLSYFFNSYLSFFPIYAIQIIKILGTVVPMGLIAGAFYFYKIKR